MFLDDGAGRLPNPFACIQFGRCVVQASAKQMALDVFIFPSRNHHGDGLAVAVYHHRPVLGIVDQFGKMIAGIASGNVVHGCCLVCAF